MVRVSNCYHYSKHKVNNVEVFHLQVQYGFIEIFKVSPRYRSGEIQTLLHLSLTEDRIGLSSRLYPLLKLPTKVSLHLRHNESWTHPHPPCMSSKCQTPHFRVGSLHPGARNKMCAAAVWEIYMPSVLRAVQSDLDNQCALCLQQASKDTLKVNQRFEMLLSFQRCHIQSAHTQFRCFVILEWGIAQSSLGVF